MHKSVFIGLVHFHIYMYVHCVLALNSQVYDNFPGVELYFVFHPRHCLSVQASHSVCSFRPSVWHFQFV